MRHLIVMKSGLPSLLADWKQTVIRSVSIPTRLQGTVGFSCLCSPCLVHFHLSFTSFLLQNEQRGKPADLRDVYSAMTTCKLACPAWEAQTPAHHFPVGPCPRPRHAGCRSTWPLSLSLNSGLGVGGLRGSEELYLRLENRRVLHRDSAVTFVGLTTRRLDLSRLWISRNLLLFWWGEYVIFTYNLGALTPIYIILSKPQPPFSTKN